MTSRDLVTLVFRILGILLGLQSVNAAIAWAMMAFQPPHGIESQMPYLPPLFAGLVLSAAGALVLFFQARRFAGVVVPEKENAVAQSISLTSMDEASVFTLFLRITGAFAIAWGIPELAGHGMMQINISFGRPDNLWTVMTPGLVKVAIGIYLLRGGSHIVRLAYRDRDGESHAV